MAVERRQSPWWVPLIAIAISAVSMILGPCFGAGVAVLGNYVTNANRSVLAEAQQKQLSEDMKSIRESLQKLVDQDKARVGSDATTMATFKEHENRIHQLEEDKKALEAHDGTQERTIAEIKGMIAAKK